ncbi:5'-deoxynucleotidase [Cohnella lubricantis]|uniref:5'-deoxynucleotidase n=1 Tax=Cohnella lubricantis TaxID=2163172 RepID=A0A841TC52_9BACL|nr:5'-deoxynucleotidase [Cohnella lubricantis]MBB6676021.1 5'-deoxynucleotidase [Cohnella lubricantis]MBP2117966.1 5'-deoxynucleotidase [Cohnella lubricantis]
MSHHFVAYLYRLQYIERWSLMRKTTSENVAEHSYHTALLAHLLGNIAKHVFGRDIDPDKAASYALFHDATEVITGDIPTPVKHHNPELLGNFRRIEQLAADRLLGTVPVELRDVYRSMLSREAESPELAKLVKAADVLDAYLKCVKEMSAGNREFATARRQMEERLQSLNMPEVDWFLNKLAPSFEKTIDELSEEVEDI